MMSQKAIHTWLNKSNKGDKITYYRGYLCDPFLQPIAPTNDRDRSKKIRQRSIQNGRRWSVIVSTKETRRF